MQRRSPGGIWAALGGLTLVTCLLARTTPVLAWLGLGTGWPSALILSVAITGMAALGILGLCLRAKSLHKQAMVSISGLNPMPVLELGRDGRVLFANAATERLFPELRVQLQKHPFIGVLDEITARIRDEGSVVREVAVGEAIYEQHIVYAPERESMCIYGLDITRRKTAARAQQQSEENFARVFRLAPVAISLSRLSDSRFLDVNDSFIGLFGYASREEIVGRAGLEVGIWMNGGDRARVLELLSKADGAVHNLEMQVRHQDGSPRDVILSVELMDFDGEACLLSTLLDVTEHRRAEAGIAILKAFYENTLKELPIEVAVLDDEGRFFYLNPAAIPNEELRMAMFGKTSIEFALEQGLDPTPFQRRHEWILEVIHAKEMGQLEEVLAARDGTERHLLRVAMPVLDEEGEVLYVVGYGIDITDRKLVEQKLREAKNAAEEMARLKTAFVTNMSHEIRTPLTAILGFASVLNEELEGERRELVEIIKQSGERLLETLNSVLDLARLEANALTVEPQSLNLSEELAAAARIYRPMAQDKGLTFVLGLPPRTVRAQLDRACLHRILSNLLSNAIKFTDRGEVRLALETKGAEVQIQVQDTGIGVGVPFLPYLFDEFKQESTGLARTHTGSGLGLSITRHLVERMNGRIEVDTTKGQGTTFTVVFPAMAAPPLCVEESLQEMGPST